nr:class I SAM-dependent methyltransferase [Dactylosporangium thailandense]
MTFTPAAACRSCAGTALTPVLDLGTQPLANAYRRPADARPEPRYPLGLLLCDRCALVQLSGHVDPRVMFDDYPYFSSYSETMVAAMRELAGRVTAERKLGPGDLVVDVGSNDGYLLRHYRKLGVRVLGIDPARNITTTAVAAGIPTLEAYFGTAAAAETRAAYGPAAVIHANNVMAHVPDVNDFTAGVALLLADDGVLVVESPYVVDLVTGCEFDTIYHEHVFYYSMTSMTALLRRHSLTVTDVEHLPVHGGTLRYTIRRAPAAESPEVGRLLDREANAGIAGPAYYRALDDRICHVRARLLGLLTDLRARGARIAAYGAAAKGTVLLNHFGITTGLVDAVIDRNPHKQGRLIPGVGIPIVDPGYLAAARPTHVLLLVWNLLDEVLRQQPDYLRDGGRFVVPLPEPRIVGR